MQIMQAKFQAVYVLMKMLHCHIRYIYIYNTHDYIHDILIMNISCLSGIFINLKFTEEENIKKMFHAY